MRVRIGYLERVLGTIEDQPDGRLRLDATDAASRAELVRLIDALRTGAPAAVFVRSLRDALHGYWWAQDCAEDASTPDA